MQHHVVPMLYQHQVQGITVSPVPVKVVHVKTVATFRRMGNGQDITGETMESIKPKPAAARDRARRWKARQCFALSNPDCERRSVS